MRTGQQPTGHALVVVLLAVAAAQVPLVASVPGPTASGSSGVALSVVDDTAFDWDVVATATMSCNPETS